MTAEALSPPNPAESLRERLIREGSIVPEMGSSFEPICDVDKISKALESLNKVSAFLDDICHTEKLRKVLEHLSRVSSLLEDSSSNNARKSFIYKHYLKALHYVDDIFNYEESEVDAGNTNVVINCFYALSVKHLKVIDSALRDVEIFLSNKVSILRSGFFFAFKENMKNTP